jgi:hypothetical protein
MPAAPLRRLGNETSVTPPVELVAIAASPEPSSVLAGRAPDVPNHRFLSGHPRTTTVGACTRANCRIGP